MAVAADHAAASQFFALLARVRESFLDFERSLWKRFDHKRVREHHWVSPSYYQRGPTFEEYVELDLIDGRTLTWCFELRWRQEGWLIESAIVIDDHQGQRTFKAFPDRSATSLDELENSFRLAVEELFAANVGAAH